MKNQWLVLAFIIGVIAIVVIAFNSDHRPQSSGYDEVPADVEYEEEIMEPEGVQPQEMPEHAVEPVVEEELPVDVVPDAAVESHPAIEPVESAVEASAEHVIENVQNIAAVQGITNFSGVPYTIQIASVKDLAAAQRALADVVKKQYPGFIAQRNLGDKGIWYRVYIGQFDGKQQADDMLSKVKKDFPSAFVISPSKKAQSPTP